ncbi:MAG: DUF3558 family protein [Rhodococcus sp.]|uniref:DUF3558 family protein n=1 Tax=Rhodococcus TaxID=1827 RepID=UPI0016993B00|nr:MULTISPECIES: DUF3558 family protein [Rhodococcus]NLV81043.1 DUF3558 family protein [Rhodococcus sp. (in: high G+C Gram-positive bacteria)]
MDTAVRIAAGIAGAIALVVGTTGCSASGDEGTAVAASAIDFTAFDSITFNPCLDIPEQLFRDLGVEPTEATLSTRVDRVSASITCSLRPSISASGESTRTLVDIEASTRPHDEHPQVHADDATRVDINGRGGLMEADDVASDLRSCALSLSTAFGSIVIDQMFYGRGIERRDACESVQDFAETIEQYIDA